MRPSSQSPVYTTVLPDNTPYEMYKRIKLIGEGSFGKAYLVESLSDGKLWVIKQISLETMNPAE